MLLLSKWYTEQPLKYDKGEFFSAINISESTSEEITKFLATIQSLVPTYTAYHSSQNIYVSQLLSSVSYVFIRNDSIRPSLTHSFDGPHSVLQRNSKISPFKNADS